jgi:hypothetical protein
MTFETCAALMITSSPALVRTRTTNPIGSHNAKLAAATPQVRRRRQPGAIVPPWRRRRAGDANMRERGPILASQLPTSKFGFVGREVGWTVARRGASWRNACKSMKTW